jgi:hypothetical protein
MSHRIGSIMEVVASSMIAIGPIPLLLLLEPFGVSARFDRCLLSRTFMHFILIVYPRHHPIALRVIALKSLEI